MPLDLDRANLNDQQRNFLKKFRGPSLVIAGPGTGKTRTVAVLVGQLLEEGYRLKEILALTFSDKAANELRERVLAYYPGSFDECWISTFHSFCARILREQYHLVGIDPDFRLLTGFKEAILMDGLCRSLSPEDFPVFGKALTKRGFQQEALTFISLLKSNLLTPDQLKFLLEQKDVASPAEIPQNHASPAGNAAFQPRILARLQELAGIFRIYESELQRLGYLDFRDLIALTVRILQTPEVAARYRTKFRAVLVDEFQDTDPAQFLLLSLLKGAEDKPRIAVIGDPRQSIYRFRGADPGIIASDGPFKERFKAKIFPLSRNYRSAGCIVELAGRLKWTTTSAGEDQQKLIPMNPAPGFIELHETADDIEEAKLLARRVSSLLIYGGIRKYAPREIAILVRNNYQIDLITEALQALAIPYDIAGDMKFFLSEEVNTLASLLKASVLDNDEGRESLKRAFASPLFKLDQTWVQSVLASLGAKTDLLSLLDQFEAPPWNEKFPRPTEDDARRAQGFSEMMLLLKQSRESPLAVVITRLFLAFSETLSIIDSPAARNMYRFRDLAVDFAEIFQKQVGRPANIGDFMRDFDFLLTYYASTLETETSERPTGGVRLLTVHQSKGLEFPVVLVPGLCEDSFPVELRQSALLGPSGLQQLKMAIDAIRPDIPFFNPYPESPEEHLEEERRLFFVAITRAQEGLILSYPRRNGTDEKEPAPFLAEIGLAPCRDWTESRPLSLGELRLQLANLSPEHRALLDQEVQLFFSPAAPLLKPREFSRQMIDRIALPEDFRFSPQSLKDYLDCPRRFYFKRILRLRDSRKENQPGLIKGNALHACLQALHQPGSSWEAGAIPTDEEFETILRDAATPLLADLDTLSRASHLETLREGLFNYRQAIFHLNQINPRQTGYVEEAGFFRFRGFSCTYRCDRVIALDGEQWIIDYKTSASVSGEKMAEAAFPEGEKCPTEIQLPFYLLAFRETIKKPVTAMTLYVSQPPYKKKYRGMDGGYLKSASLNFGCGPAWGIEVNDSMLDRFADTMETLMRDITQNPVFDCRPSEDPRAITCRSTQGAQRSCEFGPFCGPRLRELQQNRELHQDADIDFSDLEDFPGEDGAT